MDSNLPPLRGEAEGRPPGEDRGTDRVGLPSLVALLCIVALGTGLRLLGISFGLPYHHHWDEGWIVDSAAGMLRHHDSVPASYQYGAPMMRLTELVFRLSRWLDHASADVTSIDAKVTLYLDARIVTALVSSTGIVAIYLAALNSRPGKTSIGRALAAALLYAVASELVLHSRYAVTDACLVGLTAWTLAFTAIYLARRSIPWGLASAFAAGVTFAFKAPGIMTSLIPLFAMLLLYMSASREGQPRRAHGVLLLLTVPIVLLTYVILNPHLVDHGSDAMHDLVGRYKQTRDGGFSSVYLRPPGLPHLVSAVVAIVTKFASRNVPTAIVISVLSIWGIVLDVRRRTAATAVAAAYAVCLILSVALPNRTFLYRNYLVVIPVISLGFGAAVEQMAKTLHERLEGRPVLRAMAFSAVLAGAAAAIVGLPVLDALGAQRLHDDPRVRAFDWIAQDAHDHAPADVATTGSVFDKLVMDPYPELQTLLQRPGLRIAAQSLDACPAPVNGPLYVVDASYRDTHRAPRSDPWQGLWLFEECPGYQKVATFEANPYEVDVQAYPTWPGRVSAVVLRREE